MLREASCALVLAGLVLAGACGTHRGVDPDDDKDAGEAGASGKASAGKGGGGGTGGTVAGSVKCGVKQCAPPQNVLAALPIPTGIPAATACCVDSATAQCGSRTAASAMCEPPATPDTRCPGVNLGALGAFAGGAAGPTDMAMSGCCIENKCGLDGALFGLGCVENGAASSLLSSIPLIGGLITVPAARACDATPDEPEADGGAEDAG